MGTASAAATSHLALARLSVIRRERVYMLEPIEAGSLASSLVTVRRWIHNTDCADFGIKISLNTARFLQSPRDRSYVSKCYRIV